MTKDPLPGYRLPLTLLLVACLGISPQWARGGTEAARDPLPAPVVNPYSTEICMNSRISYHGGWSGVATDQMLANVLHATARAPATGAPPTIYAATAANVYLYDPIGHSLVVHKAGDWRSDTSAAFELGVAATNMTDAGAAMHLAQLESIALWTGTAGQLASCPRASATTYANSHWDPDDPLDIVVSFGRRNVAGFTTTLVAVSSDGSLPSPRMDGPVYLDDALEHLSTDSTFSAVDLSPTELSQLLWAAYGCSNHSASGKAGLVCASAVANYYLTARIYSVAVGGVHRYHNRRPPGTDATTRDHRIELLRPDDVRPGLRAAIPRLPQAPNYLVACVASAGDWPELEVGFAAMGAVLEASALGLHGLVTTGLSAGEQSSIRSATGIPSNQLPMAIVSLGRASASSVSRGEERHSSSCGLSIENRISRDGSVLVHYRLSVGASVDLAIYDCLGREVKNLFQGDQEAGPHTIRWDGRESSGRPVRTGVYFCRLRFGDAVAGAQTVVIRG